MNSLAMTKADVEGHKVECVELLRN